MGNEYSMFEPSPCIHVETNPSLVCIDQSLDMKRCPETMTLFSSVAPLHFRTTQSVFGSVGGRASGLGD